MTKFETVQPAPLTFKPQDNYQERYKKEKLHINSTDLPYGWNAEAVAKKKKPKKEKQATVEVSCMKMSQEDMAKALLPGPGAIYAAVRKNGEVRPAVIGAAAAQASLLERHLGPSLSCSKCLL